VSFIQIAVVFELMNQLINRWGISTCDKGAVKLRWMAEAFTAMRIVYGELYAAAVASGRVALQVIAAAMAKGRMIWDLSEAKRAILHCLKVDHLSTTEIKLG
jgi:hypothetical protein